MIRILHSVSNMDRAGIETMLMNYYRHMDREKIQFDFLCNKMKPGAYDDEIRLMGGKIYRTPGLNPMKYPKYLKYMEKLFNHHPEYKIIEAHNGALGVYALHAAKVNNVQNRIFHAHASSIPKDWKFPIKLLCKSLLKANTSRNFTCGIAAAEFYFGKNVVKAGSYELIPNAIEVEQFIFNTETRNSLRQQFNLVGKHIIGHVGRFVALKNHKFLLDIFSEITKKDPDAVLVLLGDGELLEIIKHRVNELNLVNKVIFVGNVENANEWYSAFDVFVLPSTSEGLPVVGVEAQAADLPCIFSENITKEIGISDKASFLSLNDSIELWANKILCCFDNQVRKDNTQLMTESHYNIHTEAEKLEKRYMELYEGTTL